MTPLPAGHSSYNFALPDQNGRTHYLKDYAARPLVLAFFSDLTPSVAQELCALRDTVHEFDRSGAKIFGITPLASASCKAFHDANHLPFPILHDAGAQAAQRYGVVDANHHVRLASFAVDNTGHLALTLVGNQIDAPHHGKQLLRMASCCFAPVITTNSRSEGYMFADCVLPRTDNGQGEHICPGPAHADNTERFRATVLLFVSAQCPCSQGYDARFKAFAEAYSSRKVRFLAINAGADETVADAEAHRVRAGFPFPVLKDTDLLLTDRIGAKVTPEVFVLDDDGAVRYSGRLDDSRDADKVTKHDAQEALDALLAGKLVQTQRASAIGCAIVRKQIQNRILELKR